MRKDRARAVRQDRSRDREPRRRMRQRFVDAPSNRFGKPQSVAGVAGRSRREVIVTVGRVRKQPLAPYRVLREAAGGEHNAFAGAHSDRSLQCLDVSADDAAARILDQCACRRLGPDRNIFVKTGLGQPRDQRISVHQLHRPAVEGQVAEKFEQHPPDIKG